MFIQSRTYFITTVGFDDKNRACFIFHNSVAFAFCSLKVQTFATKRMNQDLKVRTVHTILNTTWGGRTIGELMGNFTRIFVYVQICESVFTFLAYYRYVAGMEIAPTQVEAFNKVLSILHIRFINNRFVSLSPYYILRC